MSEKRVRNLYEQLLLGEVPIRPYRNTNLVTVDSERKSIEERTAKKFHQSVWFAKMKFYINGKKKRRKHRKTRKSIKKRQKGGAFGMGMALGMGLPLVMGTLGKILNVKING